MSLIICPECGHENQEDARYCDMCGIELPLVAEMEEEMPSELEEISDLDEVQEVSYINTPEELSEFEDLEGLSDQVSASYEDEYQELEPEPEPAYYQEPEPEPAYYQESEPEPAYYQEPEPEPAYSQEPEPEPAYYQEPEPEPAYSQEPEPEPAYYQEPEPEPAYSQEPEPEPAYSQEPEPEPAYYQEPEPEPAYYQEPEPEPAYYQEPEPELEEYEPVAETREPEIPIPSTPVASATVLDWEEPELTPAVPPTPLEVEIAVLIHTSTGTRFELPSNISQVYIGKINEELPIQVDLSGLPDSDIISRVHAMIHVEGEKYYLEDAGSLNTTSLNGEIVKPGARFRKQLNKGDTITMGRNKKVNLTFDIED